MTITEVNRKKRVVSEDGEVGPGTAYSLVKWAVENWLKLGCMIKYTNIRMASLMTPQRFLYFFV